MSLRHLFSQFRRRGGLIRILAFICLLLLVIFAFRMRFENLNKTISEKNTIADISELLNETQKEKLFHLAKQFKRNYGLDLRILLTPHSQEQNTSVNVSTLFVGIYSDSEAKVLIKWIFPPILEASLGEDRLNYLRKEHFSRYIEAGKAQDGLVPALEFILQVIDRPRATN